MASERPKGYWIARVDVSDPQAYERYRQLNRTVFEKYGAHFLVRGPAGLNPMGTQRAHNVIIEFADYDTALACYHSAEYQAASQHLKLAGEIDFVIVPGHQG